MNDQAKEILQQLDDGLKIASRQLNSGIKTQLVVQAESEPYLTVEHLTVLCHMVQVETPFGNTEAIQYDVFEEPTENTTAFMAGIEAINSFSDRNAAIVHCIQSIVARRVLLALNPQQEIHNEHS